ncbi:MAG: YggS family pyridoxal phosphate-dependent enzyme [Deltaproteobacteria bacterium]|nr:YggS family pyridoxal phosphate-dependent enzyme [Deltaproteobacteria bacterium]
MSFPERLAGVQARIDAACARAGRDPSEVRLVAVSKRHPPEAIRAAYEAGVRDFGENYAQELRDKAAALADLPDLRWHFIGPVQRNKVRYLAGPAHLCHGLDRLAAAEALSDRAEREGVVAACLVAVHLGGEESKHGARPEELPSLLEQMAELPGIEVRGLMSLPPYFDDPEEVRPYFRQLAALRDSLEADLRSAGGRIKLSWLSMGMSHDLEVAIEEGATLVRVGTALFGQRPPKV